MDTVTVTATIVEEVLGVRDLRKIYGGTAVVDGLSFAIQRGECYALLGPNGAGKTTTLRVCLGLTDPTAGRSTWSANPCRARRDAPAFASAWCRSSTTSTPTSPSPRTCSSTGATSASPIDEVKQRLPELLEFASLAHKRTARIGELSGGMKRRLILARALVNDPDLIFMDEPTTGLDPQARHLIWERLKTLLARGKTILLTTHFMDEAERLGDRLIVIDHGRMIAEGPPRELIREHIEPQVIEIYGDGARDLGARRSAGRSVPRMETSGETVFCYAYEPAALLDALEASPGLRYLHRPANLEDLFLKLTGREMRDES